MANTGDSLALLAIGAFVLVAAGAFLAVRSRQLATSGSAAHASNAKADNGKSLLVVAISAILIACLCFGAFFTKSAAYAKEALVNFTATSEVVVNEDGQVLSNNFTLVNNTDALCVITAVNAPSELSDWSANVEAEKAMNSGETLTATWSGTSVPTSVLDKVKADGKAVLEYEVVLKDSPTAFAVYSADDGSLTFYNAYTLPEVGDPYDGKTVTAVYTGFESETYEAGEGNVAPWIKEHAADIKKVEVADDGIEVSNLQAWFAGATNLESVDLSNLETDDVTSTDYLFANCGNLKSFDASSIGFSNVATMDSMFAGCSSLESIENASAIDANATSTEDMFNGCASLKSLDLSGLNTSNDKYMESMFEGCSSLKEVTGIEKWDTSAAQTMTNMFKDCSNLSANLRNWNVSNVTAHDGFHDNASSVKSPFEILNSEWFTVDTTALVYDGAAKEPVVKCSQPDAQYTVTYANNTNATTEDKPATITITGTDGWVWSADGTESAVVFEFDIAKANPTPSASLEKSYDLAVGAEVSTITLPTCDNGTYEWEAPTTSYAEEGEHTLNVTFTPSDTANYNNAVYPVTVNAKNASVFAVFSIDDRSLTFYNNSSKPTVGDTYNGKTATFVYTGFDTTGYSSVEDVPWYNAMKMIKSVTVADDGISISDMSHWFEGAQSLKEVDLYKFDTSKLTDVKETFSGCSTLYGFEADSIDFSKVEDAESMFKDCTYLQSISNSKSITGADGINVVGMFEGCNYLSSLDLSNLNVSKSDSLTNMFKDCTYLTVIKGIDTWDTSSVKQMQSTFEGCSNLTADASQWNIQNVEWGASSDNAGNKNFNTNASGVKSPFDLDFDQFTVDTTDKGYTGSVIKPSVTSSKYVEKNDYTLEFGENTELGTGTVKITGAHLMSGTKTYEFTIVKGNPTPSAELGDYELGVDESLSTITLPTCDNGTYTWETPSYSYNDDQKGEQTVNVIFTPNDTTHYNTITLTAKVNVTEDSSYAVYYAQDASLCFYNDGSKPQVGDEKDGKTVTKVYTGFAKAHYKGCTEVPWYNDCKDTIKTATVVDSGIEVYSISHWFAYCSRLKVVDLSNLNTTNLTEANSTFTGCERLYDFDASSINFDQVNDTSFMFNGCTNLYSIDHGVRITTSGATANSMFNKCSSLKTIDLSNFKVSGSISYLFNDCTSLTTITGVESWNTSSVDTMNCSFRNCELLSANLKNWNVSAVAADEHVSFDYNAPSVLSPWGLDFSAFTVDTTAQTYTGSQIKPAVTVNSSYGYVEGTDYKIVYGDNINAGVDAGVVTIQGLGKYEGYEKNAQNFVFTINKATIEPSKNIQDADVNIEVLEEQPLSTATGVPVLTNGTYAWASPDSVFPRGSAGSNQYEQINFIPSDDSNYEKITYTVKVNVISA